MIILKTIFMLIILIGMIMVLMSIRLLYRPTDTADSLETDEMRREVEKEEKVITSHSVFNQFLARDRRK